MYDVPIMRISQLSTNKSATPSTLTTFILFVCLIGMSIAIINQKMIIALAIIAFPSMMVCFFYGFAKPSFILILYAIYSFFFTTISRYIHVNQLSIGLDIILFWGFLSIITINYLRKGSFAWNQVINMLTISYIPWAFYCIYQIGNPKLTHDGFVELLRVWIYRTILLYIFLSLLTGTRKSLRIALDIVGFFTVLAFLKALWQKYVGFDAAEQYFLFVEGGARTHLIYSGDRYFSYFTDAANFGSFTAAMGLVYGIIGFNTPKWPRKIWYFTVSATGFYCMFISGTRGAMIIPLSGMMLYCLLCKNIKLFSLTSICGILFFSFFSFTTIGDSNPYIRRARTAFHSSEDASMIVRLNNRKEIAQYLAVNPLGTGFKGSISKWWPQKDGTYQLGTLPSDSYFVRIWIETGKTGLILYILMCGILVIEGCRIVLFRIQNKQLRHTFAAFTCACLGIWVSGYTGDSLGLPPTNFVIPAMMAFVMNGPYIDKEFTNG